MKKRIFSLLFIFLFLAACAAPQSNTGMQIQTTSTPSITMTPTLPGLTETPIPANASIPSASAQQTGVLSLRRLQMIDANVGWGEGYIHGEGGITHDSSYHVLRTIDGGETWQDVTPPTGFSSPPWKADSTILGIDADSALAFPPDYPFSTQPPYILVWRTNDGGKSWKASNPVDISDSPLRPGVGPRPQFMDEKHAWLTLYFAHRVDAYYLNYRSSDGGVTWEQTGTCAQADGPGPGCKTPLFSGAQTGWLSLPNYEVADPATIWKVQRSQDGGETWQTIALPHSGEGKKCYQNPTRLTTGIVGILVSCFTPANGEEDYYYLSADQGETWQIVHLPGDVSANNHFIFLNMTTGWWISKSGDDYQLERTTDGGATWQKQADSLPWEEEYQFLDANIGWVVSYNDAERLMELYRTIDGGKTWVQLIPRLLLTDSNPPAIARMDTGDTPVFKSMQMIDSLNGWAIGGNEYVFHTRDGGRTWQDVTPLAGSIAAGRQFLALDAGYAWTTISGAKGVWSTDDGGQTWHRASADTIDFRLLNEKIGFRAEPVAEHTFEEFVDGSAVLTVGKTTDGGSTWQPINLPPIVMDTDEISLDQKAYPGGIQELMQDKPTCGMAMHTFSADTIGLRVVCEAHRLVDNMYNYVFILSEYYLSTDAGASWNNWMSAGHLFSWEEDDTPVESEFFLPGGIGWRLKANQLLQTTDGGKNWVILKAVGWDGAWLDFINEQEGWGIVKSGHVTSLVHTIDGGKTWAEIKPVIANP